MGSIRILIFICDQKDLKLKNKNCVIYFYNQSVFYHKKITFMLDKAEKLYKDKMFYAVDTDYFENLTKIFDIEYLPTIILIDQSGKEKFRVAGILSTEDLLEKISTSI